MFYEEARLRQSSLLADGRRMQILSQLDAFRRLDRLQRSVRVVRARLGMISQPAS